MRKNSKRALYESIMKNVAKTVKRTLNEGMYDFTSTNTTDYEDDSSEITTNYKHTPTLLFDMSGSLYNMSKLIKNGIFYDKIKAFVNIIHADNVYVCTTNNPSNGEFISGSPENIAKKVIEFISETDFDGGTELVNAFKKAIRTNSGAMYIFTDGEDDLSDLEKYNYAYRINLILCNDDDRKNLYIRRNTSFDCWDLAAIK